jgi:hypothetical protein
LCHTTSRKLFDEFRQQVHDYVAAFMSASQRWRSGDFNVPFPVGANRPMVALAF